MLSGLVTKRRIYRQVVLSKEIAITADIYPARLVGAKTILTISIKSVSRSTEQEMLHNVKLSQ